MECRWLASLAAAATVALALTATCATAAPRSGADVTVERATIHVDFDRGDFTDPAAVLEWVRRSAQTVSAYYGRFPADAVTLRLVPSAGGGVHGGRTYANRGAFIRVGLGREVTAAQLRDDWVLVHEMTHLALPDTGETHAWLSEGIATYVEGIARVHARSRSEADVWEEEFRSMPRGLPSPGDRGLDYTHSWGRTYWGGAMFCLLADVDIRRRTALRFGLQDALRAVLSASGGLAADWPIERVLRTGDAAVGTRTLEELYTRMKAGPETPDLAALWRQLGVEADGDDVRFDEQAPLAPVRRAIMGAQ